MVAGIMVVATATTVGTEDTTRPYSNRSFVGSDFVHFFDTVGIVVEERSVQTRPNVRSLRFVFLYHGFGPTFETNYLG